MADNAAPRAADSDPRLAGRDPRDASICIVCGGLALARKCKIICTTCGYTRDCSDP